MANTKYMSKYSPPLVSLKARPPSHPLSTNHPRSSLMEPGLVLELELELALALAVE